MAPRSTQSHPKRARQIRAIAAAAVLCGALGLKSPSASAAQTIPPPAGTLDIQSLRERAEKGDPAAQFNLGFAYANGEGVPLDDGQAMLWFRKAADQGDARAQFNVGVAYAQGRTVSQDLEQAVTWYHKAADQGHVGAQFALGDAYYHGEGAPVDVAQALALFRKAAEQGHPGAQFNLGVVYTSGRGVPQDFVEAHKWFTLAAARVSGADRAKSLEARDALAQRMSPEQIADAQERARLWQQAFERKRP